MSDSAKGSLSGYLFQFERALILLANLSKSSDYISIEEVDDIATHKSDGTVLIADQSKHSIAQSTSTFEDTSYALWRTLQLWIEKIENETFNSTTSFICSTNKTISNKSLLFFICNNDFLKVMNKIKLLRKEQNNKLINLIKKDENRGSSIKSIIKLMDLVIAKEDIFKILQPSIKINDCINLKVDVYNKLYLNTNHFTTLQKKNIYDGMLGWLISNSLHKWRNSEVAKFNKTELDSKYQSLIQRPSIVSAIFRAKDSFNLNKKDVDSKKDELFVKQIELIPRKEEVKDSIIKKAIEDFIRYEIEHTYIINELGDYTKEDFSKFIETCYDEWKTYFNDKVVFNSSEYTPQQKNQFAIEIYGHIMHRLKIDFNDSYKFNTENIYIKNGSFLKLSNIPRIGWHPDWEATFVKSKK